MRRLTWFVVGFVSGLGACALAAFLLANPAARQSLSDYLREDSARLTEAIRNGIEAAREREAQIEHELEDDEAAFEQERPDYVV